MVGIRSVPPACAVVAALAVVVVGYHSRPTTEQAHDKVVAAAAEKREAVFPLGGRVTINGQVPQYDPRNPVVVMLIDRKNMNGPAIANRYVNCDRQGKFAFSTYGRQDGVPPGSYALVMMKFDRGPLPFVYHRPEQLRKLYDHPDKHAHVADFQIEHAAPGKTDYALSLTAGGVERHHSAAFPPFAEPFEVR
jgi:hypothetical protein